MKTIQKILLSPFFVLGVLWGHIKIGLENGESFYYNLFKEE